MGRTPYLLRGIVISQWVAIIYDRGFGRGDMRQALEVIIQSFNKYILGVYCVIDVMLDVGGISDQHDRHYHLRTSFTVTVSQHGIAVMGQTLVLLGRRTRDQSPPF